MEETIQKSMDVWEDCANARFLQEMAEGSLSEQKFYDYIIQDSIYLRGYLKCFAYAMTQAETLKDMQLYYSLLGYVNDAENVTRLHYLSQCGMTDEQVDQTAMRPQCRAYINFLLDTARSGDQAEILMATMPCMLGYAYVFQKLRERAPHISEGCYAPLVADYTSAGYQECCDYWTQVCNEKCRDLDAERREALMQIFRQGSLHELYFWQMAGEEEK